MHDTVGLEKLGIPTAVVITTVFQREADVQRTALGMTTVRPVVITHPLSTLTDEEIVGRARQIFEQAPGIWLEER